MLRDPQFLVAHAAMTVCRFIKAIAYFDSGAPANGKNAKRSPILIWKTKGNPLVDFLMVIMASGIARGRVRTTATTTTESRNLAAILQIIG